MDFGQNDGFFKKECISTGTMVAGALRKVTKVTLTKILPSSSLSPLPKNKKVERTDLLCEFDKYDLKSTKSDLAENIKNRQRRRIYEKNTNNKKYRQGKIVMSVKHVVSDSARSDMRKHVKGESPLLGDDSCDSFASLEAYVSNRSYREEAMCRPPNNKYIQIRLEGPTVNDNQV